MLSPRCTWPAEAVHELCLPRLGGGGTGSCWCPESALGERRFEKCNCAVSPFSFLCTFTRFTTSLVLDSLEMTQCQLSNAHCSCFYLAQAASLEGPAA